MTCAPTNDVRQERYMYAAHAARDMKGAIERMKVTSYANRSYLEDAHRDAEDAYNFARHAEGHAMLGNYHAAKDYAMLAKYRVHAAIGALQAAPHQINPYNEFTLAMSNGHRVSHLCTP